ncbi:hypothetical protein ACSXCD_14775 (plasmid) [Clostridium perfringens]
MRNNKKKEQRNNYGILDRCNTTIYTYESWVKCYGNDDWDTYVENNDPILRLESVVDNLKKHEGVIPKEVLFCTIDNKYFKWLNDTHEIDSELSRSHYASLMSNEVAIELWNKYELGVTMDILYIPITFMYPKGNAPILNLDLSTELVESLESDLSKKLTISSVTVLNKAVRADYLLRFEDELVEHMYSPQTSSLPADLAKNEEYNVIHRFIPCLYTQSHSPIYNLKDINSAINEEENMMTLNLSDKTKKLLAELNTDSIFDLPKILFDSEDVIEMLETIQELLGLEPNVVF